MTNILRELREWADAGYVQHYQELHPHTHAEAYRILAMWREASGFQRGDEFKFSHHFVVGRVPLYPAHPIYEPSEYFWEWVGDLQKAPIPQNEDKRRQDHQRNYSGSLILEYPTDGPIHGRIVSLRSA